MPLLWDPMACILSPFGNRFQYSIAQYTEAILVLSNLSRWGGLGIGSKLLVVGFARPVETKVAFETLRAAICGCKANVDLIRSHPA